MLIVVLSTRRPSSPKSAAGEYEGFRDRPDDRHQEAVVSAKPATP
jgi:hypothetical protein